MAVISNPDLHLDTKVDFSDKANLQQLHDALVAADIKPELKSDEEHSAWMVTFQDATNAERRINTELAAQPDYKKLRSLAKQTARFNIAPFVVVKSDRRESQPSVSTRHPGEYAGSAAPLLFSSFDHRVACRSSALASFSMMARSLL